ncbi:Transcription factor [Nymphaea thermarum]|nr:Transcription factor [Nymphaea thermarum]
MGRLGLGLSGPARPGPMTPMWKADKLRRETLHQLPRLLTVRQAARCFLAIGEYFHRLRALSSLWLARPKPE